MIASRYIPEVRPALRVGLTVLGLIEVALLAGNAWIVQSAAPYVYNSPTQLPDNPVGMVLGTSPYTHTGHKNKLFAGRIRAAASLYEHGKVAHLLISGANPSRHYNEPRKMYQALRKAGIPDAAITLDFAGFRTLDSVARARQVFGLQRYTIISQRFHDYRAVFLARHKGMDVVAYDPRTDNNRLPLRTQAREFFARVKAVLDLYVLHTQPRMLGEPVPIDVQPHGADPTQPSLS